MRAKETLFLSLLRSVSQFVIPDFQRPYRWKKRHCKALFDDILAVGADDTRSNHFVGSFIYELLHPFQVSACTPLRIIDGQQRLTTIMLILEILARHIGDTEPIPGFSAQQIRHDYLLNAHEQAPERRCKLLMTEPDRDTLLAILQQQPLPDGASRSIMENFAFLDHRIRALAGNYVPLCLGLLKLLAIDISTDSRDDDSQQIFERTNSTGCALEATDMIRNLFLMGLPPDRQHTMYTSLWRPLEYRFAQTGDNRHFESFIRNYVALHTGAIPGSDLYPCFKEYAGTTKIDSLLADMLQRSAHYVGMALPGKQPDPHLDRCFRDLRRLRLAPAFPLLLRLYHDYSEQVLTRDDFLHILRLVESFIVRRAVCGIHAGPHRILFADFARHIRIEHYPESVEAWFRQQPPHCRFPSDNEFIHNFRQRDFYNFSLARYCLDRLESLGRKEHVPTGDYSIEHVMPQAMTLHHQWKDDLGSDWQRVRDTWLHTIGNLSLTGCNTDYADRPFAEKRDMPGGFHESPIRLNRDLAGLSRFDETAIKRRAAHLSDLAVQTWPGPTISDDVLRSRYESSAEPRFTLDDHPHQRAGAPMHPLFHALRQAILALDPGVTMSCHRHYIAFKVHGKNFADCEVQRKRIRRGYQSPLPGTGGSRRTCGRHHQSRTLGQWRRRGFDRSRTGSVLRDVPDPASVRQADGRKPADRCRSSRSGQGDRASRLPGQTDAVMTQKAPLEPRTVSADKSLFTNSSSVTSGLCVHAYTLCNPPAHAPPAHYDPVNHH